MSSLLLYYIDFNSSFVSRQESEEIWKTLESTERAVVEKHLDSIPNIKSITALIGTLKSNASDNTSDTLKGKHDLNELYDYYLAVS